LIGNQIWSDAVQASGCGCTQTFNGGDWQRWRWYRDSFNVDCLANPNHKGDFFSWEAINQFGDKLCPYPWRVPTAQDFIDLDITMGGTGTRIEREMAQQFVFDNYINRWGGAFGGHYSSDSLRPPGNWGSYWSQSIHPYGIGGMGVALFFSIGGWVAPDGSSAKNNGHMVRCVRDN